MRLYLQQGLSARVVQALHRRLERAVSMAAEGEPHVNGVPGEGESRGNDAGGDRADRSRSPTRAAFDSPGTALEPLEYQMQENVMWKSLRTPLLGISRFR